VQRSKNSDIDDARDEKTYSKGKKEARPMYRLSSEVRHQ